MKGIESKVHGIPRQQPRTKIVVIFSKLGSGTVLEFSYIERKKRYDGKRADATRNNAF